ncbi:MAG TPA: hypothetical protein DIC30_05950 [Oceanospirillales bacterium]|jgi:thiol-disulfide isomerase/thioredoxin|nr:hypothetical protein [Oleispira sp.]HCM05536.1 hypothetical protein [Oceanospirillales bacterium]|tara:strand:- start:259 stop:762 length:504 start_codon:yes stop_codon:yes gene_type:complete
MKRRVWLISVLLISFSLMGCKPINETAWYGQLVDRGTMLVDGEFTPWNHWEGQWRIVNIWAQWCKPCWQEIPELNEFYAEKDSNIKLLGYNFDELSQEELQPLKAEMDIQFPVLVSWPEVWSYPEVKGLPATLIIAPDNRLIKILWGPQTLVNLTHEVDSLKAVYSE